MLIHGGIDIEEKDFAVDIENAEFPAPFKAGLEFNSPAHGTWNIVHTGMLMPEAIQIYVCAENCMRGVVLTAAEMNAADRFSFVIVEEKDIVNGALEDLTIEGVSDILLKLDKRPRAVLLFTVCIHHFMGCDLDWIYKQLENRFPDVVFIRCFMDPIKQKHGLTPDQKLRKSMYDPLTNTQKDDHMIALIGNDFTLDVDSDIRRILSKIGYRFIDITTCRTWEEYQDLGNAELFISCYPAARYGAEELSKRLGRKLLYLPGNFDYREIKNELIELLKACKNDINMTYIDSFCNDEIDKCEEALARTYAIIGDTQIAIDYTFHPRPLGLAKLLLEHGFNVREVYLDSVNAEEKETFDYLKINYPKLKLIATIRAEMRVRNRNNSQKILAIGQKAAWFTGSKNFVNLVSGGGMWGFEGICETLKLMTDAYHNEKDPRDLIVRKGWGCESCI